MTVATLPSSPAALRCHKHREERAAWRCDSCGRTFCDPCLKEKVAGRRHADSCPVCQGFCRGLIPANDAAPRSCLEAVQDAFAYPLRGHGAVVLVLGAILLGFLGLLARSWSWRMGLFFGVFAAGYLSAFMFRIAETSANGSRQLPDWPEFTDIWESAALPFFQMAVPWICCLAPASLPFLIFGWSPEGLFGACAIAFAASFYVPMAILSIAVNNSVAGVHPSSVLPAIWAVKAPYLATWLLWSLLGGASIAFEHFVASGIPFAGSAINGLLSLYLITVEMRLLGLLYFSHSDQMKLV